MAGAWDHIRTIGSVLSILGVGAGLALYFSDFKSRLEKLESQVQLIAAAPAIVRKGSPDSPPPAPSAAGKANTFEPYAQPITSPLIDTCIDLIKRTATVNERGDISARVALESLQRDYNCRELLKSLPTR